MYRSSCPRSATTHFRMFPKIFFSTLYIILASICIYIIYIVDHFLSMCLLDDEVESVEPDAQPSVQPSAATFAQPSAEPRATSVEPDLAQLPVEPRATSSRTSIVEPNLQPARTRNLGVQTDGLTEMEDLRSQLQDLKDLRRAGEQELEDLRRELAAERKTSDQLRLQLSLQGKLK